MKKIRRSILIVLLCIFLIPILSGCTNYKSLNDMSIVIACAVDRDEKAKNYKLSFEIVDTTTNTKEKGVSSKIVESEGATIFEAIRNAKTRLTNKLYFGNMEIVVVNQQLASEAGIPPLIDFFMRDREPRETISFVISKQKTAKEILTTDGINSKLIGSEIHKIIGGDARATSKTKDVELYMAYQLLMSPGIDLILPAFSCVENNKFTVAKSDGLALFKQDSLVGYLSPLESLYFLFVTNDVKGGTLTFESHDNLITLEVFTNQTSLSYSYDKNLKVTIQVHLSAFLGEIEEKNAYFSDLEGEKIKVAAQEMLEQSILKLISKVQAEFNADIFGFGSMVYKHSPSTWEKMIEKDPNYLKTTTISATVQIDLLNSGLTKN